MVQRAHWMQTDKQILNHDLPWIVVSATLFAVKQFSDQQRALHYIFLIYSDHIINKTEGDT